MKSQNSKSASKPTNPINLLRGAIGQKHQSKPLLVALNAYKAEGPVGNFTLAYVLASASTHFPSVFTAAKKVTNQAALGVAAPLTVASLSREIQWAAVATYVRRDLLNSFVASRQEFFDAFISGRFEQAEGVLEHITATCGESSWVLENRIALLTVSGGFEKQKKFVQQLTRERGRSNVSFMATHFGERNEPRVTAAAFEQQLKSRANAWDVDEDTKAFLSYKLTNRVAPAESAYASILAHEGTWSIIDLYESLLDLIRRSKAEKFHDKQTCLAALNFVEISDPRIACLQNYLADSDAALETVPVGTSNLMLERGRLHDAEAAARKEILASPSDFSALSIYAKVRHELALPIDLDGWLPKAVESAYSALYSGARGTAKAADDLLKLSMNLRHADFCLEIMLPVAELTSRGVTERRALMKAAKVYRATQVVAGDAALTSNAGLDETSSTRDALDYRQLLNHIERGNWDDALEYASRLEASPLTFYRTQAAYFSAHILEKLLRIEEAIERSVALYNKNPSCLILTPLFQILKSRGFRELKLMEANPALASAFYIYGQHTGRSDKEVSLKVAWKRYLASRNADRPSTLLSGGTAPLADSDIFFFSHVCKQETMELGGAFSSQMDLDRERMQICVGLAQLDQANLETYDQEIVDLTRRINIEEGVEYLESSRVFVDEIGILTWAKKNLESQFLRYIDYLKAGMFSSAREIENRILKIATTAKNRKVALENYLDDYDVSAESLLEEILIRLARAFLSRPRFGLDAFLSSRVRHGSFVGYLRGPLESKRLVTKKNSSTNKYFENDFILNQWGITSLKERNSVNSTLTAFSAHVDGLLDEAVNKFLHVRSKSRPEGMVTFTAESGSETLVAKRWLLLLKSTLNEDSTLDDLISHCFQNLFWPSVKVSLDRLQAYVRNDLGHELTYAIEKLADDVRPHLDETRRGALLRDRFYAKQELKTAIDRVAQWFDSPKNNTQLLNMYFPRAIEIGLQSTKYARPNFNPHVDWNVSPEANLEVGGAAIGIINDISFLIFANISKHSGFEEIDSHLRSGPAVEVRIKLHGDAIEMTVISEISPKKDIQEVRDGIASAKAKIAAKEFDSVTQGTQGTGLVRLAISSGLQEGPDGHAVQFGLDEENRFFVRILIARGIVEPIRRIELPA